MQTCGVIELSEQRMIDQLIERMMRKYPAVPPDAVATVVRDIHARVDGRPLRDYVPLLVERRAHSELVEVGA
ncbi:MAG: three-helix bundle dimerization domain-containing protein [Mycobacterium sp.]|uniref:three-helix bundle dimerization domain-containing protein n=1 Tax=Mycobacterium sp. TaxID=1785 RepID=UPI003F9A4605